MLAHKMIYLFCTGFSPCSVPFVFYLIRNHRSRFSNPRCRSSSNLKTLCSFLFRSFQNILRLARIQFLSSFVCQEDTGFSPCSIPFVVYLIRRQRINFSNPRCRSSSNLKTLCSFLFRSFQNILRLARIQFLSSFVCQEDTGFSPCSIPFVVYLIRRQRINFSNPRCRSSSNLKLSVPFFFIVFRTSCV